MVPDQGSYLSELMKSKELEAVQCTTPTYKEG